MPDGSQFRVAIGFDPERLGTIATTQGSKGYLAVSVADVPIASVLEVNTILDSAQLKLAEPYVGVHVSAQTKTLLDPGYVPLAWGSYAIAAIPMTGVILVLLRRKLLATRNQALGIERKRSKKGRKRGSMSNISGSTSQAGRVSTAGTFRGMPGDSDTFVSSSELPRSAPSKAPSTRGLGMRALRRTKTDGDLGHADDDNGTRGTTPLNEYQRDDTRSQTFTGQVDRSRLSMM
jgi:hypothetical protein